MKHEKGQIVETTILDAAEGARWFARLEDGAGLFVRGVAAPGDRVRAEIRRVYRKRLEGRLIAVLEPSAHRVEPPCPHFGTCGGCKWQHVDYREQLRTKRKIVTDALERIGHFQDVAIHDTVPADRVLGYRNKVDFSFADRRYILDDETEPFDPPVDFALGFHAPGMWKKALHIERCLLADDRMNRALDLVRRFSLEAGLPAWSAERHVGYLRSLVLRSGERTGDFMVNLVTSRHDPAVMEALSSVLRGRLAGEITTVVNNVTGRPNTSTVGEEEVVISGPGSIHDEIDGCRFRISANSFFQTNTGQAEVLFRKAMELAEIEEGDSVIDFYCGGGSLSLLAARRGARVLGLELVPDAVADARFNAQLNRIAGCRFEAADLNRFRECIPALEAHPSPRVVITDPPRAGMHPKAAAGVARLGAERIVYVSCKAASLARDAAILCEGGTYILGEVCPVDLFPQTRHVESVALFLRNPTADPLTASAGTSAG